MRKLSFCMLIVLLTTILLGGSALAQDRFTVYSDYDNKDNHFFYKAAFFSDGGLAYLPVMDEKWAEDVHGGTTAIQCQFEVRDNNWGGWYFQNGVVPAGATALEANWGTYPNAGLDLSGYGKLTFWARGLEGGENVEFFCLGIGRDPTTGATLTEDPYPDSCPKMTTGNLVLEKEWKQYPIDLTGCDLSYVLGGFGWATSASVNSGKSSITFYLDDIYFEE